MHLEAEPRSSTSDNLQGVRLEPLLFEQLTLQLFGGTVVDRQTLYDEVLRHHTSRGGSPPTASNPILIAKTALKRLRQKGLAENVAKGQWRIGALQSPSSEDALEPPTVEELPQMARKEPAIAEQADRIVGAGEAAVYVYYLPTYRAHADQRQSAVWECKIGMTNRDPLGRVLSQADTALPERPRIALVIRTDQPSNLEGVIQNALKLRGRHVSDAPGSEWFLTNPDEVEAIWEWASGPADQQGDEDSADDEDG